MIRLFITSCLLLTGIAAQAQNKVVNKTGETVPVRQEQAAALKAETSPVEAPTRIDLSRDVPATDAKPAGPVVNNQLLQPSGQGVAQPYRTTQVNEGGMNGTTVQPVNATSNQFNLGGQKATNTIYYDNSGRMTGNSTSIKLGGK